MRGGEIVLFFPAAGGSFSSPVLSIAPFSVPSAACDRIQYHRRTSPNDYSARLGANLFSVELATRARLGADQVPGDD